MRTSIRPTLPSVRPCRRTPVCRCPRCRPPCRNAFPRSGCPRTVTLSLKTRWISSPAVSTFRLTRAAALRPVKLRRENLRRLHQDYKGECHVVIAKHLPVWSEVGRVRRDTRTSSSDQLLRCNMWTSSGQRFHVMKLLSAVIHRHAVRGRGQTRPDSGV